MVLPRSVARSWRFTRFFYRTLWFVFWLPYSRRISDFRKSDSFLSFFGPLSLLLLLTVWAASLIFGFALLHWSIHEKVTGANAYPGFGTYLYFSGVTFYTLGYGDIAPTEPLGRLVAVMEAGTGFAFLGIIIGYLPVIYGAFSRREGVITMLDARAGSPPSALEMLHRHSVNHAMPNLDLMLRDMEKWAGDVLESHLSYPVLAYYRSQHDEQSWISAIMVVMDTCALVMTGLEGVDMWQAQLTFAMCRHALVDLCLVFFTPPAEKYLSRLTPPDMERMIRDLAQAGIPFSDPARAPFELAELRKSYEPYAVSLARSFSFALPPFVTHSENADNWQRSAWDDRMSHF